MSRNMTTNDVQEEKLRTLKEKSQDNCERIDREST